MTRLLSAGDGQVIYFIAAGGDNYTNGYRWSRPLPIVLSKVAGLGNANWIPYAMFCLAILGCGVLVLAVADWLSEYTSQSWIALAVVLFPGVLSSLQWLGFEPLGLGLAIWGFRRKGRILLVLAALQRETLLAFALARKEISTFVVYFAWAGFA
ncbi:MAG: hypothetical protein LC750_06060, partial [Actinobacteria bacterium]|nr:hypothetical protein [Actinomycetota bacterium]